MRISARVFWCEKAGTRPDEYEDAFAPASLGSPSGLIGDVASPFLAAVADGATEASFSQLWARLLVRSFCRGALEPNALSDSLARSQGLWARVHGRKPLPWYAEEKRRMGAFAAFVGITIGDYRHARVDSGRWNAWAVGDCCLFQVRADRFVRRFPLVRSAEFDSRPVLIPSLPAWNASIANAVRQASGRWRTGDRFYLMSDALAAWFLRESEAKNTPWRGLARLRREQADAHFTAWIQDLRAGGCLRNDDVTLVCIELG